MFLAPSKAAPGQIGCFSARRLVAGRRLARLTVPGECFYSALKPFSSSRDFLAMRYPWYVCSSRKMTRESGGNSVPLNLDFANYLLLWDYSQLDLANRSSAEKATAADIQPMLILPSDHRSQQTRDLSGDQYFGSKLESDLDKLLFVQPSVPFPSPLPLESEKDKLVSMFENPSFWRRFPEMAKEWEVEAPNADNIDFILTRRKVENELVTEISVTAKKSAEPGAELLWTQEAQHYKQQLAMKLFGSTPRSKWNAVRWVESILSKDPDSDERVPSFPSLALASPDSLLDQEGERLPLTKQRIVLGDLVTRRKATPSAIYAFSLRLSLEDRNFFESLLDEESLTTTKLRKRVLRTLMSAQGLL